MRKPMFILLNSMLILSACSSSQPHPKSWRHDLSGTKEEPINTNPQLFKLFDKADNKDVWSK